MGENSSLYDRACRVLVGGVNSPVRSFRSVGGTPYFVARAEGPYVYDEEGRRYIDYVQSYGASIVGHAHPRVTEAISAAAARGAAYGAPTVAEVRLAELIAHRVPGVEMVRMTSSGTEAVMSAVRLARGITGRDKIIKFAGCYHGTVDSLLAESGSGVANQGLPGTAGVTAASVADTLVVPYNIVPDVGEDVAAVVVEPVAANMGVVAPAPGFLAGLREACSKARALLIFDEVITGFRLDGSGASGTFAVTPDLWCFAKVIGGGLPVGAVAGPAELMRSLAPVGPVYQGGTMSGNPVAVAAGLAALELMTDDAYSELRHRAHILASGMRDVIALAGIQVQVPVVTPLVGIFFSPTPVANYDDAKTANATPWYRHFFHALLERGVALAPGPYEAIFPSMAHTEADLATTIDAAGEAALLTAKAVL